MSEFLGLLAVLNLLGWTLAFVQTIRHSAEKYGGGRSRVCETTPFDPRGVESGQSESLEKI